MDTLIYVVSLFLVQEGCRIVRNCSLDLQWEVKLRYLNKLVVRIKWAGMGSEPGK